MAPTPVPQRVGDSGYALILQPLLASASSPCKSVCRLGLSLPFFGHVAPYLLTLRVVGILTPRSVMSLCPRCYAHHSPEAADSLSNVSRSRPTARTRAVDYFE